MWESEIGMVEVGKSYSLNDIIVREFWGMKFLSTSKDKSRIESISDNGEVAEEDSEKASSTTYEAGP